MTTLILNGPKCLSGLQVRDDCILVRVVVEDTELDQAPSGPCHRRSSVMRKLVGLVGMNSLHFLGEVSHSHRWHHSAAFVAVDVDMGTVCSGGTGG